MKTNWRSTLGGAVSGLGKALVGVGVVPQLSGTPNKLLTYIALTGFLLDAVGGFIGHLLAADARDVQNLADQVKSNTTAIDIAVQKVEQNDTSHLVRDVRNAQVVANFTKS